MGKIVVSKDAVKDLQSIQRYIEQELDSPHAAQKVLTSLRKAIQGLEMFPGRGRPLDALISVHTEYRYLVCENYSIFYLCEEDEVMIIRVLYQRQDSIRALFLSTKE